MAKKHNRTHTMLRAFLAALFAIIAIAGASALTINQPVGVLASPIAINVTTNTTQDSITYSISPGAVNGSCENCSEITASVNLSPGNYTLVVSAFTGNASEQANASFIVEAPLVPLNLTIYSPVAQEYNTTTVPLHIATAVPSNVSYTLDGTVAPACNNCTEYIENLTVDPGNHTLIVFASVDNQTVNESVSFSVVNATSETAEATFSFMILAPEENETYNASVPLHLQTNTSVEDITYAIDNGSQQLACSNCSQFNTTLTLSAGTHVLHAIATNGNESHNASVAFTVAQEPVNITPIAIEIDSPHAQVYGTHNITIELSANIPANISYTIDNASVAACTNCTHYVTTVMLADGAHTLLALATAENQSANASVNFSIDTSEDEDTPRYSRGLNKLPKQLERGEITDEQLAQIIREGKINPGTLNRLIKTGKLGNASIEAIIETQDPPPGIWRKFLRFIGIELASPKQTLLENVELSEAQREELLLSPAPEPADRTAAGVGERDEDHGSATPPGVARVKKSGGDNPGKGGGTPPGLAKKQ